MLSALQLKILGYLGVFALAAGLLGWFTHHERAIGKAECQRAVAEQHAKDLESAQAQTAAIEQRQQESSHEADKFRAQTVADRVAGAAVDVRLQQRIRTVVERCVPADPAAAPGSPPASSARDLSADVLGRSEQDVRALADFADSLRAAAGQCAGHYDALPVSR